MGRTLSKRYKSSIHSLVSSFVLSRLFYIHAISPIRYISLLTVEEKDTKINMNSWDLYYDTEKTPYDIYILQYNLSL